MKRPLLIKGISGKGSRRATQHHTTLSHGITQQQHTTLSHGVAHAAGCVLGSPADNTVILYAHARIHTHSYTVKPHPISVPHQDEGHACLREIKGETKIFSGCMHSHRHRWHKGKRLANLGTLPAAVLHKQPTVCSLLDPVGTCAEAKDQSVVRYDQGAGRNFKTGVVFCAQMRNKELVSTR